MSEKCRAFCIEMSYKMCCNPFEMSFWRCCHAVLKIESVIEEHLHLCKMKTITSRKPTCFPTKEPCIKIARSSISRSTMWCSWVQTPLKQIWRSENDGYRHPDNRFGVDGIQNTGHWKGLDIKRWYLLLNSLMSPPCRQIPVLRSG